MHTMMALVIGLGIGGASYLLLVPDFLVAGWTAVVWFVAVRSLTVPLQAGRLSQRRSGVASGVLTALAVGPALLGVSPLLSIDAKLRLALQLLVLGTGFACGLTMPLLDSHRQESTPSAVRGNASKSDDQPS